MFFWAWDAERAARPDGLRNVMAMAPMTLMSSDLLVFKFFVNQNRDRHVRPDPKRETK